MPRLRSGVLQLLLLCALQLRAVSLSAMRVSERANSSLSCAAEFSLWDRHCYRFSGHPVRRTFHHAERHCGRMLATLASLHSTEEERFALQLTRNGTAIWIGLSEEGSGGSSGRKFRWTDGSALSSHTRWRAGEPSESGHLHCTQADQRGWALASGGCSSTRLPFVCKRRACSQGLEWNGRECDIITKPSPSPSSLPPPLSSSLFLLLFPVLCIILLASLTFTCKLRSNHIHFRKSPPHIQDV